MRIPSAAQVVELGEWEALVIPVPPTASYRWRKQKLILPPKPEKPMAEYPSVAGHTERVEALPESKEYNAWLEAMVEWQEKCDAMSNDVAMEGGEFALDYAILAWRSTGSEDEWSKQPPNDWEPSGAYSRHELEASENERLEFILHELLCLDEYLEKVNAVMYPKRLSPEMDTSPVTREEVAAALATFPVGDAQTGTTRRMVRGARGRRFRKQHTNVSGSTTTTRGRSERDSTPLLVRIAQRLTGYDPGSGRVEE